MVSDSSDVRAAVIDLQKGGKEKMSMTFVFSEEEKKFSSGHREL
jgi:hypothetical protein